MTLVVDDKFVFEASIRGSNDANTTAPKIARNNHTATVTLLSSYTPSIVSTSNCSATISTANNSSASSVSTIEVDFSSSSTASFAVNVYQPYGGRIYSFTGTASTGSSTPAMEMTMSGDNPANSVQLEIKGVAGKQISLNDYGSRILANATATTPNSVSLDDMYGKTYTPTYPHGSYNSANDTFTDTDIPAPGVVGSVNSNTVISGTEYWRRVTLTYTGTAGTKYLHISAQLDGTGGTASYFRGDAQFASYAINDTIYPFERDNGTLQPGWETYDTVPPQAPNPDQWNESAATTITAFNSGSNGRFVIRSVNSPTGSGGTGRLYNIAQGFPNNNNTSRGFGFFETSGNSSHRVSNQYYHAKSPGYVLNPGDTIDVYYGVDCASLEYLKFAII